MNLQLVDQVPDGWTIDRMKDLASLRNEKVTVDSEEQNYLELDNIESGTGKLLSRRDTRSVESAITKFSAGDVLFGKLRPYLAKYHQPNFDGYCTGEILAFKPERIYGRFLFYCVGSDGLIERCSAIAYGAKMPRVNWATQLGLFDIPHPPIDEQKRIADYLDASCEAIDRAVETKQKQLDTLDALRKSIIQKAVTQGLDPSVPMKDSGTAAYRDVPTHWRKSKLRYQIQISNGKFASDRVVENGDIPIYGGNGVMGYTDEANATAPFVVIGRVGAHCGNAHYVGEDAWVSDNAMLVTTMHNPEYMAELFTALDFNTQAATTAQPVITGTKIKNTYVYLPGPDEQEEIVLFVKSKRQELEAIRHNIHSQVRTLNAYRKSLIHECVTGKRRISDEDVAKVKSHV